MGLEPGARVANKYTLTEILGQGGFGTVWRARHEDLGEDVALKLLNPDIAQEETARARFLKEVRTTQAFVHKYAVQLRDFGRDGEQLYFTMDLVEGRTLRQILDEGPLPLGRAVRLVRQVLEVLEEAHAAEIVHRDLKPANLILTQGRTGEEVRVLDFGIAKAVSTAQKNTTGLTLAGMTIGTLAYMSPEQAQGKKLDGRSDLYSVGAVLYQALSGRLPVEAEEDAEDTRQSLLFRLVASAPTPLREWAPEVPPALEEAVMRALEKAPGDRYADAAAFRAALEASASGALPAAAGTASYAVTGAQAATPARGAPSAETASHQVTGARGAAPGAAAASVGAPGGAPLAAPATRGRGLALLGILLVAGVAGAVSYPRWAPLLGLGASPPLAASPSPSASLSPQPAVRPSPSASPPTVETPSQPTGTVHGSEADYTRAIAAANGLSSFRYLDQKAYACGQESFAIARFEHPETGLVFHLVPGGTYLRGSEEGESDEVPVTQVSVKPFLICATECTQEAWQKAMGTSVDDQRQKANPDGSLYGEGSRRPIYYVSWTESQDFCRKTQLRLPSEAEWEYACRAGSTAAYAGGQGEDVALRMGWFFRNSGRQPLAKGTKWDYSKVLSSWGCEAQRVGQQLPNAFGLQDMHGNVWEWCEDVYANSYRGAPVDGSARKVGDSKRVCRGGGWGYGARYCRSANRLGNSPSDRSDDLGFRPVRSLP